MVICLERGANDSHMVQLMPLPPHRLLRQQNPEWFILLVPAYSGCPEKRPLNGCVCVCVSVEGNALTSVRPSLWTFNLGQPLTFKLVDSQFTLMHATV